MERKSAWSLPMSEQEIVNEYKAAKKPQNQIAILADQNSCDKKTIVNILELNGCELPGNFKKKKKAETLEELGLHYAGTVIGAGGSGKATPEEPPFPIPPAPKEVNIEKKTLLEDLDFAKVHPALKEDPLLTSVQIKLAALRAIDNMVSEDFGDERGRSIFAERVAGILEFVREVEHGNY